MPTRGRTHRAASHRRRALWGLLAIPVFLVVGLYLARGVGAQSAGTTAITDSVPKASPCTSAGMAGGSPCAQPLVTASMTAAASPTPSAKHKHKHKPAARRSGSPSPGPSASAPAAPPLQGPAAAQVLALINQARAQAGLPAYTVTSGLDQSAGAHNALMAGGCGLSHQCPGEPALGARETAAGVHWTSAGENIGEGGPVSDTSAAIAQMAVNLTQSMLNEKPPDDGHRLNILSSSFHHIGIVVQRDSSGTVWMTQDFSN